MKKYLIIAMLVLTANAYAQPHENETRREEIEQKKIAFITSKINLTTAEAQSFWPVYNEYQNELKAMRTKGKEELGRPSEWKGKLTEAEIDKFLTAKFAMERKKVDTDEAYYKKFKQVLPMEKVALYYEAEMEFKKELMRSMRDGGQNRRGKPGE